MYPVRSHVHRRPAFRHTSQVIAPDDGCRSASLSLTRSLAFAIMQSEMQLALRSSEIPPELERVAPGRRSMELLPSGAAASELAGHERDRMKCYFRCACALTPRESHPSRPMPSIRREFYSEFTHFATKSDGERVALQDHHSAANVDCEHLLDFATHDPRLLRSPGLRFISHHTGVHRADHLVHHLRSTRLFDGASQCGRCFGLAPSCKLQSFVDVAKPVRLGLCFTRISLSRTSLRRLFGSICAIGTYVRVLHVTPLRESRESPTLLRPTVLLYVQGEQ